MFCEHVGFCFVRAAVRAISVFYWWEVGWRRRLLGCRSYPLCQPPRLCRITDDIGYGSSPASRAVPLDLLLLLVYRLAVNDLGLMSAVGHPLPSGSSSPLNALRTSVTLTTTAPAGRSGRGNGVAYGFLDDRLQFGHPLIQALQFICLSLVGVT